MKTYNVYGVEMTSLEEMRFSKYLDNEKIAMNTFYKDERKKIAENWLNEYRRYVLNGIYESNIDDKVYILTRITKDNVEIHNKKDYPDGFVRIISKESFFNYFTLRK
jgi:hypothetical protein